MLAAVLTTGSCSGGSEGVTQTSQQVDLATPAVATDAAAANDAVAANDAAASAAAEVAHVARRCRTSKTLVFEDAAITSSTGDRIYGAGIVVFDLQPGGRLSFLNDDGSVFGEVTAMEDLTFQSSLPRELTARKLIATADHASFEFDAEAAAANGDFLFVYINGSKKQVLKAGTTFRYLPWKTYLMAQTLRLKKCNLLADAHQRVLSASSDLAFDVVEVEGEWARIRSSGKTSGGDAAGVELDGWLPWRSGNRLLVEFAIGDP